jgi:hypothetical protein
VNTGGAPICISDGPAEGWTPDRGDHRRHRRDPGQAERLSSAALELSGELESARVRASALLAAALAALRRADPVAAMNRLRRAKTAVARHRIRLVGETALMEALLSLDRGAWDLRREAGQTAPSGGSRGRMDALGAVACPPRGSRGHARCSLPLCGQRGIRGQPRTCSVAQSESSRVCDVQCVTGDRSSIPWGISRWGVDAATHCPR